jgi:site-specific DNA-methyltransferase (adenine-specific)
LTVHYRGDGVELHHGDCLDVLATLPDNSIDAVVTDPPYGLDFMGKHWDTGAVAFNPDTWQQCLRVLKPGGHLAAFGGTRTWHRLACAIEDAGFEIRDSIAWLYGSGFPKSLDVSKAIDKAAGAEREVVGYQRLTGNALIPTKDKGGTYAVNAGTAPPGDVPLTAPATHAAKQWQGWGTALKPAFEPIVIARKPLEATVANNVLTYGTGALNIDGCRIAGNVPPTVQGQASSAGTIYGADQRILREFIPNTAGRWPTNVVLDETQATELDKQSGTLTSGKMRPTHTIAARNVYGQNANSGYTTMETYGDSGGASRFYPVFKYQAKAPTTERPNHDGTGHPTVKPVDLMRWLIRLVTPPGGTVLDPFVGSGTTAEAAIKEHKHAILIEREDTYLPLIVARLSKPMAIGFNFDDEESA